MYLNDLTHYMDEYNIAHFSFEHMTPVEVVKHKANNLLFILKTYAQSTKPDELIAGVAKFANAYWLDAGGVQFTDYGNHNKANFKISGKLQITSTPCKSLGRNGIKHIVTFADESYLA